MGKKIKVTLPKEILKEAKRIAELRIKNKKDVTLFEGGARWEQIERDRTLAQAAIHYYCGIKWKPRFKDKVRFDETNFPFELMVRTTPIPTGFLPVQKNEPQELICVLVTVEEYPVMTIRGYIEAGKGKKRAWLRKDIRRPCYGVPQSALKSFDEIKKLVKGEK